MTTVLDLVTGALRKINAYAAGESISSADASDAMVVLNDMLEVWSNEHLMIYNSVENILSLSAGKYQYTIGNPTTGTFIGTTVSGQPTISGVTPPSSLVVGGSLSGPGIPSGAVVQAIGVNTVTMSANATATYTSAVTVSYTTPGDFAVQRPLRITNAFTRITSNGAGLDYPMAISHVDQYAEIGYKSLSGPWPKRLYYDPTYPLGTIYFWPNPSQSAELHLWTDNVLAAFTSLTSTVSLPQGYAHAIKCNLALLLSPEYGKMPSPELKEQARLAKMAIKDTNAVPQALAEYDRAIVRSNRADAGWIMHGGFK